jgi:ribosome maturation factor RimP
MVLKEDLEKLIEPILREHGCELYELDYCRQGKNYILRIYIDKLHSGGITVDECAAVSESIGKVLDEKDVIPQRYILEVSSPGLDRELKVERDFRRMLGYKVVINLQRARCGRGALRGEVVMVDGEGVEVKDEVLGNVKVLYSEILSSYPIVEVK